MNGDPRLQWLQLNRTRTDRVRRVREPIAQLVRQLGNASDRVSREVASAIAGVVDDEFRRHCRIAVGRGGTLTVRVDRAAMVYPMRLRWFSTIREVLARTGGRHGADRIAFVYGGTGAATDV